ncbi:23S rRNA (guanosine-2'-O-)-methyltransferase RlmB [Betaproteobacteria bacterium]|nr:23S rRNA (guanosine-2'-O-)-methyltransferase RlmB [Betaproteobacteria bacterium]GHU06621.1 23S rRNA (guanosine-2'-O-)-methyltransferase RlmB [Betaproteobacteria bacterium]GHU22720.1 23S rRNA (guanosine-2'-O-)-methyltransferase RlmB [Betaproteobacteria bacterium]
MSKRFSSAAGNGAQGTERGAAQPSGSRLIYGFHAVLGRLRRDPDAVFELFLSAQRGDARAREATALGEATGVKLSVLDGERLDHMVGTRRHQGIVARVDARNRAVSLDDVLENLSGPALLLVLDGVQDPHNLGACLRVADAAGVDAVIAPKDRAVGINATVVKVASGAVDTVPYVTVTNLARALRQLQEAGVWVIGTAGEAEKPVYDIDQRGPVAWVMGAEGDGLRRLTRDTCDELARIPLLGTVESLNVSVASGICLFETRRQRGAQRLQGSHS